MHIKRIVEELEALPGTAKIPFLRYLENVHSMPKDSRDAYDKIMSCGACKLDAGTFGWVTRSRLYWAAGPRGGILNISLKLPTGISLVNSELVSTSRKPTPARLMLDDGYALDPAIDLAGGKRIYTFTREFKHPPDHLKEASLTAQQRWWSDAQRFPPAAYEDHCLAWKGQSWRQLAPAERAVIMGIPPDHLLCGAEASSHERRTELQNCLVGNGFHIPSICLIFLLLLQTATSCHIRPMRDGMEDALAMKLKGTALDPSFAATVSGRWTPAALMEDMDLMLSLPNEPPLPWDQVHWQQRDLDALQSYWVDTQIQGLAPSPQGPEWQGQVHNALLQASCGTQRAPGNSKKGLDHLFRAGYWAQKST